MSGIFNETMPEIEEIFVSFKGDKQVKSKKKERKYSWLPKDEAIGHECDDLIKATHDINECFDCGDKVKKKEFKAAYS
jgi:nitrate reductase cytochrome c-type subunit